MQKVREYIINRVNKSKPHLIEAFTHVYGSKHHEFIKDRINSTKVCVCNDEMNLVDLYQLYYHVRKADMVDKEELLKDLDFLIKCRKLYDDFDLHMIKELKKMFPTLKRKKNPMEFIDSVLSFDKKFTLNEKENNKIRKLRMSYFKDLGLDLGDNYSLYTDSKKAKELMLDRKQKSEFNKLYNKLMAMQEKLEEYFSNNFSEIEFILEKNRYDNKSVQYRATKGVKLSYCMPNTINGEIYPLCMFNMLNLIYPCELVYLHEFSHAIGISGKNKSNLYSKGKFKHLNEAVEEASIKEVYDYMLEHKYHIIHNNPGKVNDSIYNDITPIGEAFVEKFRDDMEVIRFGKEDDLYKIVDESFLSDLDIICSTILEQKDERVFVKELQTLAIKKIKEYTPIKKR